MKILNVNATLDPVMGGGTAERTYQLSRYFVRAGIECKILTTEMGLTADFMKTMQEVEIVALPLLTKRFYIPKYNLSRIQTMVSESDVIHLMGHWAPLIAIVCREARKLNKPYVVCPAGALNIYGRSKYLKLLYNSFVGNRIVRNASGHVAITASESIQYERYGIDRNDVLIIPNGIDCEKTHDRNDVAFRLKHGLGNDPFMLFVGRLNYIKGPDLLLNAFLNMCKRLSRYHLVFAGPDGGMLPKLRDTVAQSDAAERVHFIGYAGGAEKYWAYQAADVLVVPSRQEAMSLVALEAGVVGTPVVLTDQCGTLSLDIVSFK